MLADWSFSRNISSRKNSCQDFAAELKWIYGFSFPFVVIWLVACLPVIPNEDAAGEFIGRKAMGYRTKPVTWNDWRRLFMPPRWTCGLNSWMDGWLEVVPLGGNSGSCCCQDSPGRRGVDAESEDGCLGIHISTIRPRSSLLSAWRRRSIKLANPIEPFAVNDKLLLCCCTLLVVAKTPTMSDLFFVLRLLQFTFTPFYLLVWDLL